MVRGMKTAHGVTTEDAKPSVPAELESRGTGTPKKVPGVAAAPAATTSCGCSIGWSVGRLAETIIPYCTEQDVHKFRNLTWLSPDVHAVAPGLRPDRGPRLLPAGGQSGRSHDPPSPQATNSIAGTRHSGVPWGRLLRFVAHKPVFPCCACYVMMPSRVSSARLVLTQLSLTHPGGAPIQSVISQTGPLPLSRSRLDRLSRLDFLQSQAPIFASC